MTYRNKLLLKRLLIVLAILLGATAVFMILGFSYLGRFVVYTENGAYFSFQHNDAAAETLEPTAPVSPPENPVLITGTSVYEEDMIIDEDRIYLEDYEVYGLFLDYETLSDGSSLNAIDLVENEFNTLVLEMRSEGSEILSTDAVQSLISRAKKQSVKLVALISCLDDSQYALENGSQALPIEGGALWVSSENSYWLNPSDESVQDYIEYLILTLCEMGFQEVILNNFYFPESTYISYDTGESTRADLTIEAYQNIEEDIGNKCTLGLFISDAEEGHQAFDCAEHLYVYFEKGTDVKEYYKTNSDHYIVFVTASRDTRFDEYGKIIMEDVEDLITTPDPDDEAPTDEEPQIETSQTPEE